jgi:hemerythrin
VKFHFTEEEKDMTAATSAGKLTKSYLDGHKAAHAKFVEILSTVKPTVSDDVVDYAMKWLVNHIKGTDFQYKDKL